MNSTIDAVACRRMAVIDELAAYGQTDLLCYRADSPEELVAAEQAHWDPPLAWLHETHGIHLQTITGIRPLQQDDKALVSLARLIDTLDAGRLAGLHMATTISGSVVLGLARIMDVIDTDTLWAAVMVDENHQNALWGEDPEETRRKESLKAELADLEIWLSLL